MTGSEIKEFIKRVYLELDQMETAGDIPAGIKGALGVVIVQARLSKEGIDIN